MKENVVAALNSVLERLTRLAREEPTFRSELLVLLESFQQTLQDTGNGVAHQQPAPAPERELPAPPPPLALPAVPVEVPAAPPSLPVPAAVLLPQRVAAVAAEVQQPWQPYRRPVTERDLKEVEARCRLKAEASRWAATRRRLLTAGASFRTEIEPQDQEIIEKGKVADCFLWMCSPYGPSADAAGPYDLLAGCFEAASAALGFVRSILEIPEAPREELETSLHLLAEGQSALRVAAAALDGYEDDDQMQIFYWLKNATSEMQIYVRRHMKRDDPADPARMANLLERIQAARTKSEQARKVQGQRKKLFGKIRHKLSLLPDAAEAEKGELWQGLIAAVEQLVSGGLPPSNRDLREYFLPVADQVPDLPDLPKGFQLFLREIDRYRQGLKIVPEPSAREEVLSADVAGVAQLLAGRSMVLIGGDLRQEARDALKRAFDLKELIWITTKEHQSFTDFEPMVARPEVAVVLLAIRWTSHSYAEVQRYCERYGKPLVRLPGGYNPNQVAAQILMQCSDRLATR